MDLPDLIEMASGFSLGVELPHSLHLRFGTCVLRLGSNSQMLVRALRRYFNDFLQDVGPADIVIQALEAPAPAVNLPLAIKEPDPGKTKIKEEFIDLPGGRLVRKRLTGMVFLFGPALNLAVGPCQANDNQVVNFINSRYIQWMLERGHLLCHAAAVSTGGAGLALAGLSGRGKSTLALHMMSLGLDFNSNDRLLIRRAGKGLAMHGVAKLPRINPGTVLGNPHLAAVISETERKRFSALPPEELWQLEHKYDAYLDRLFGPGRFHLNAKMCGLLVLTWRQQGGEFHMEEVGPARRAELLMAFMKSSGLFFLHPGGILLDHSPASYLAVLGDCPVYELSGGANFKAAARAGLRLLEQGGPPLQACGRS